MSKRAPIAIPPLFVDKGPVQEVWSMSGGAAPNGYVLTIVGGVPTFAPPASGPSRAAVQALLGADVIVATTTETTVMTVALGAGAWVVTAFITAIPAVGQTPDFLLDDSTTRFAAVTFTYATGGNVEVLALGGLVTLAAAGTVRLRVKPQTASSMTFSALTARNATPGATRLVAIPVS